MSAKYIHDCDSCKYLGTGTCSILGNKEYDFYICEHGDLGRTLIARYGSLGYEYMSGILFSCVELTPLDKVALYNNLELTEEEEGRLLRVFARMWKEKLTISDYQSMNVFGVGDFGNGNVVWEKDS